MTSDAIETRPDGVSAFRDPNEAVARILARRLQREIVEHERRLMRLLARSDPAANALAGACRRAIRVRREMLADLPLEAGAGPGAR